MKTPEEIATEIIEHTVNANGFTPYEQIDAMDVEEGAVQSWIVAAIKADRAQRDEQIHGALDLLDQMNEQSRIEYDDYRSLHDALPAMLVKEGGA